MTRSETIQVIGSTAILIFAILLARIGLRHREYGRYGREALLCASGFLVGTALVRMLATFAVLTPPDARAVNGMVGFGFLAILVQIILVRRKETLTVRQPKQRRHP